jgi:signal transduction histidine kinase
VTWSAKSSAQESTGQRAFVSDVFHSLSQPLTALHCSLELSLARDQTSQELRASVESALENAERLRQRLLLLRELSDADDHGDISAPVELHVLLRELREDLLPVCESAGGGFDVACDPVLVRGNSAKLTRAFFYLVEYLLRNGPHVTISVRVEPTNGRRVEIRMVFRGKGSVTAPVDNLAEPTSAGEVEIARRALRAVGGELASIDSAAGRGIWIASLPISE